MNQINNPNIPPYFIEGVPESPLFTAKSTIRISLFIFSPISFAKGSPGLWYSQPLTEATVPEPGLWVLVVNTIIEIAALLSRKLSFLSTDSPAFEGPPGSVRMTLPELAAFLKQLQKGSQEIPGQNSGRSALRPGVVIGPPTWFTVFILLTGYVNPGEQTPRLSLFVPIFSLEGITGALPIIIIGLIAAILIRHVVPPSSSGITPVPDKVKEEPKFQFGLQEIFKLLKSYNGYFN